MQKALIISGATASGKSSLALDFAALKPCVIINADALQIFKGLPILSAQPTSDELNRVSHKLYSALNFDEKTSVASWLEMAASEINQAFVQGKIPIIVGGTGMYISKLLGGIAKIPEISLEIHSEAQNLFSAIGREKFIAKLHEIGEENMLEKLDKQRLIRLYEVLKQTGKTLKSWQKNNLHFAVDPKIFTHINLEIDREILYQNCDLRFEKMLKKGVLDEVRDLINQGVTAEMQIAKTLGFFEIGDFLNGKISQNEMIKIAAQKTRNYAKRQLTWFRNQFDAGNKIIFRDKNSAFSFLKNEFNG